MQSSDLLALMLGRSEIAAGEYPVEDASRPGLREAQSLREVELNFTQAHELVAASRVRVAVRRAGLGMLLAAMMLVGGCIGAAAVFVMYAGVEKIEGAVMTRAAWRVTTITEQMVTVQVGHDFWPVRPGEELPNGERVLMIDDETQTIVTDSGTFRLAPVQQGTPQTPAPAAQPILSGAR